MKICSFFGHRNVESSTGLKNKLILEVEKLINNNYSIFLFGGLGEFDEICWEVVTSLKHKYQFIKRIYCVEDARYLRPSKRPTYFKNSDFEDFIYLDLTFDWWYQRIYFRNCAMIDRSDFIIFYANEINNSGAFKALKYARKTRKEYFNIINTL